MMLREYVVEFEPRKCYHGTITVGNQADNAPASICCYARTGAEAVELARDYIRRDMPIYNLDGQLVYMAFGNSERCVRVLGAVRTGRRFDISRPCWYDGCDFVGADNCPLCNDECPDLDF